MFRPSGPPPAALLATRAKPFTPPTSLLGTLLLVTLTGAAACRPPDARAIADPRAIALPTPPASQRWEVLLVDPEGDKLYMAARLNGRTAGLYALDTGAMVTTLDATLAGPAGVVADPRHAARFVDAHGVIARTEGAVIDRLRLGDELELHGVACWLRPRSLGTFAGLPVLGLLGMNALRGLNVTLDFDRGRVVFVRPSAGAQPVAGSGTRTVPLTLTRGGLRPTVELVLDGRARHFALDTGAPHVHIDSTLGRALGLRRDDTIRGWVQGISSRVELRGVFRVRELRLGPLVHTDRIIWPLAPRDDVPEALRSGLAGLDVLAGHNATLDLVAGQLHLAPRARHDDAEATRVRIGRWGRGLPTCGGPDVRSCFDLLPAARVRTRERGEFVALQLGVRSGLDRRVQLILGIVDASGQLLPSSHWIRAVVNRTGPRVFKLALDHRRVDPLYPARLPPFEAGRTRLVIIDAIPFAEACEDRGVCLQLQVRRQ